VARSGASKAEAWSRAATIAIEAGAADGMAIAAAMETVGVTAMVDVSYATTE
jgi:hypothetical protein